MTKKAFDISEISQATREGPASWSQCQGVALKLSRKPNGSTDWLLSPRLKAHLGAESKAGRLSFMDVNGLFKKKKCPVKYIKAIAAYLDKHPR